MVLLAIALVGLISSTIFLGLVTAGAFKYLRSSASERNSSIQRCPRVSLLKPLCGLEPGLEGNLRSFFHQNYPEFEIIFGTRDANDPALQVVRSLRQEFPTVAVQIIHSGPPQWPNAKVYSLQKMYESATSDYIIISDSDVAVAPNYIHEVVGPLLKQEVGLVTCVYRGVPSGGLWSLLEALGMSVEMTSGVIVANMLEGMKFALGPTMASRRDVIDDMGGISKLADYCADDYVFGERVHRLGKRVVLSHHVIDHIVVSRKLKASILHQLRWMKSTRLSRRAGHIGSGLTFAVPFGVVGLVWGIITHHIALGMMLLAASLLNRALLALIAGGLVVRDMRSVRYSWLYPLRDLTGFALWCASFFGHTIEWRGQRYRLASGGRMVNDANSSAGSSASGAVAVDDLA